MGVGGGGGVIGMGRGGMCECACVRESVSACVHVCVRMCGG